MNDPIGELIVQLFVWPIVALVLFYYPIRKVCVRAGLSTHNAFWVFVPFLGFLIILGVLAFSSWPNQIEED